MVPIIGKAHMYIYRVAEWLGVVSWARVMKFMRNVFKFGRN